MSRFEKWDYTIAVQNLKLKDIAKAMGVGTYQTAGNNLRKAKHTKEELEIIAKALNLRLVCQFVYTDYDNNNEFIITGNSFTDMIKELMTISGKTYDFFGEKLMKSKQNAHGRIKNGKFSELELCDIAAVSNARYDEQYYLGKELL